LPSEEGLPPAFAAFSCESGGRQEAPWTLTASSPPASGLAPKRMQDRPWTRAVLVARQPIQDRLWTRMALAESDGGSGISGRGVSPKRRPLSPKRRGVSRKRRSLV